MAKNQSNRSKKINHDMIQAPEISFGVMICEDQLMHWQKVSIEQLLALDGVRLKLLIVENTYTLGTLSSRMTSLTQILTSIQFNRRYWSRLYADACRNAFKWYRAYIARPSSNKMTDMTDLYQSVERINCQVTKKGRWSQYFDEADLATIESKDLDFILRFGFGIIRGGILNSAKYGIWSFHHDDEQKYRGFPPCFWEIYHGDKQQGAILQRITDSLDTGTILRKDYTPTILHSYAMNLSQIYYESAKWPAQICIDIQKSKTEYLSGEPSSSQAAICYAPTIKQFLYYLLIIIKRRFQHIFRQWLMH